MESNPTKILPARLPLPPRAERALSPGDRIGQGMALRGETLCLFAVDQSKELPRSDEPSELLEIVEELHIGKHAVLYRAREVLSRVSLPSDSLHSAIYDEPDADSSRSLYGREYAIKLLSKSSTDFEAQSLEGAIHISLPRHRNIVALHRILETPSFLVFILEYISSSVNLLSFLMEDRDSQALDAASVKDSSSIISASSTANHQFSLSRVQLVASMFAQMCEAVAVCHDASVYHRNLKPDNFLVSESWTRAANGKMERKVVVKLTDFGLATRTTDSADMDCGSTPYMSYECRNNFAPTYRPRAADIWALGLVLINMLYHFNPWTDTAPGRCASYTDFSLDPYSFLLRFAHMTPPLASFLVQQVFCILNDPKDDSERIEARQFGVWVAHLPNLIGEGYESLHFTSLRSAPRSRRPSSRLSTRVAKKSPSSPIPSKSPSPAPSPTNTVASIALPPIVEEDGANNRRLPVTGGDAPPSNSPVPAFPSPLRSASPLRTTDLPTLPPFDVISRSSDTPPPTEENAVVAATANPSNGSTRFRGRRPKDSHTIINDFLQRQPAIAHSVVNRIADGRPINHWRAGRDASPTSIATMQTADKSVLSQSSDKSRKNFWRGPPEQVMLR
ncbi:kinase-like protein [Artomyces pyxidatus]|uniref:Kinase-like protein n=1 Tax=Artomyces pyxidatus TaxID=48021 RepID=A0ACB8T0B4_9AGAM|nr:kinase-like protein [Artomyces pyxidatus]